MSQTIHNFLVSSGASVTLDPRVFSFEISTDAQTYFSRAMQELQTALAAPSPNSAHISDILNALNNWSKSISVGVSGAQTTYAVDSFGNLTAQTGTSPIPSFTPPSIPGITLPAPAPGDLVFTIRSTMDRYMGETVDQLIRTFRSAGWDPIAGTGDPTAALNTLLTGAGPSIYNVANIVTQGINEAAQSRVIGDATTQSQSLQQLLMVDYVSRGNELLFNEMSQLRTAINLNQTALGYLNSLQDLMNQKDPQHFLLALQNLGTGNSFNLGALTNDQYSKFETDTFNQQLGTVAKFTEGQLATYITGLSSTDPQAVVAFQDVSDVVNGSVNYSLGRIQANLQILITQIGAQSGSGGLVQALKGILNDLNTTGSVQKWVQDYTTGSEGDYQRHVNDSIVAAQAFNDTQRTELSRVMFVFEEFYKSATAMLSRLTQLIEKMGTAISR